MSVIKPFHALRPQAEMAEQVSSVPYDVVYESEVRDQVEQYRRSFLRVTRPDGDFPAGETPSPEALFERARLNLEGLIRDNIYAVDPEPALYVYRLATRNHSQTGLVACCSIDEYDQGLIKKHEKVRPDKVEDRTGHLLAVGAQTGLIFLAFRGTERIHGLFSSAVGGSPLYDFQGHDGVRHTVWRCADTEPWTEAFLEVPALYIADGHHRAESALLARNAMRKRDPGFSGQEEFNFVLAGVFPAEDLKILAYNRTVKGLNGLSTEEFFAKLRDNFIIVENGQKEPKQHGDICMYFSGKWYTLSFNVRYLRQPDPIERLDVSILQQYVLSPVLGITDVQTDERIGFVGGRRGTGELERMVNRGDATLAFSMFPTTMDDLFAVSDMDEIMPPKSTWFEPKLKDGLLVHLI
ncbi:MAG: DUF1015 family protein [Acidobacteriota bacterium]